MLKIKDNIDLKELEKYGFKKYNDNIYDFTMEKNEQINIYEREINIDLDGWETNRLDIIYDLIKDGLVERVEE